MLRCEAVRSHDKVRKPEVDGCAVAGDNCIVISFAFLEKTSMTAAQLLKGVDYERRSRVKHFTASAEDMSWSMAFNF